MATSTDKQIAKPLMYCRRSIIAWQQDAKFLTRRLAKPLPDKEDWKPYQDDQGRWWWLERRPRAGFRLIPMRQPYAVGQLLWIREALVRGPNAEVLYAVDSVLAGKHHIPTIWHWDRDKLSAMFMPKYACRYWARVLSMRPERLQEVTDEDALAEGVGVGNKPMTRYNGQYHGWYANWWAKLHKKPGTRWEDNPWVWVYGLEKASASADH